MRFSGMFVIIIAVFVAVLIVSNVIAVKLIHVFELPGNFLGESLVYLPASIIVFPITYLVGNVLTEVYGFRVARGVIWLGFGCNLLVVIALWLTGVIPPVVFWENEDIGRTQLAYMGILGATPMILLASFTAYLIGEFSNSMTLSVLKVRTKGRFLWVRTISSTVVGQGLDSFVFISIAFGVTGILGGEAIVRTALIQWAFKIAYEVAATPLTYWVVGQLKAKEKMDAYDAAHSLNPFGVFAMPSDEAAPARA